MLSLSPEGNAPLRKRKKTITEPFKPYERTVKRYQPDVEENRYCGDILTQVAAVESALQAFGYAILKEHMETCVVEEIRKGNTAIVDEAVELVKKLK